MAAEGADLFNAKAYFYDKTVKFHLDYSTLAGRLSELGAKRVILTHMNTDMLKRIHDAGVETADDGMIVLI